MIHLLSSYVFFAAYYCALAFAAHILVRAGVLSLAHAGFASVGAFAGVAVWTVVGAAVGTEWTGLALGFVAALASGTLIAGAMGAVAVRLEGDAVLVVTMVFVEMLRRAIEMTRAFGGASGLGVSILPTVAAPHRLWLIAGATVLWAAATGALVYSFQRSGLGATIDTIRHNAQIAAALGIPVRNIRFRLFILSGAIASVAGCLYAAFKQYVAASTFNVDLGILVFVMVLAGRSRGLAGIAAAACALGLAPELLRIPAWRIPLRAGGLDSIGVAEIWPLLSAGVVLGMAWFCEEDG